MLTLALFLGSGAEGVLAQPSQTLGQMECTMTVVPPVVRAEGVAELQGDIVVICRNKPGNSSTDALLVNVSVSLNVNVTNNHDFGEGALVTDAVLIVNENNCAAPSATGANFAPPSGSGCAGSNPTSQAPQYGVLAANNRLEWKSVFLPVPGASMIGIPIEDCSLGGCYPSVTTLRISSIRANASQLGVPDTTTFPRTQVTAFLSIAAPIAIPVVNNVANIGVPILGMVSSWPGARFGPACVATEGALAVTVREGFATAFKTTGEPSFQTGQAVWEAGYFAPGSNLGGGASQGSRLLLRFFNAPAGVELAVPKSIVVVNPVTGVDDLRLQWVDGADIAGAGGAVSTEMDLLTVPLNGGFAGVVYEVVSSSPFVIESASIPVRAAWSAGASPGVVQASVTLAPATTVSISTADGPEPRFIEASGDPQTIFEVRPCIGDLSVQLSSAPPTARPGRTLRFRAIVINHGPGTVDGAVVDVTLPTDLTVERAPRECVEGPTGWTCDLGVLGLRRGARLAFAGRLAADAAEGPTAFAQVTSNAPDPNPSNDSASLTVPLR